MFYVWPPILLGFIFLYSLPVTLLVSNKCAISEFEVQDSSEFLFCFSLGRLSLSESLVRVSRDKLTLQFVHGHLGSSHSDFLLNKDFFLFLLFIKIDFNFWWSFVEEEWEKVESANRRRIISTLQIEVDKRANFKYDEIFQNSWSDNRAQFDTLKTVYQKFCKFSDPKILRNGHASNYH